MIPVTNSSNVEAVHYDADTAELHIQYKGGSAYTYTDVPPAVGSEIVTSAPDEKTSTGALVNSLVKGGGYKFKKN